MMKQKIYIETSVISYLTARPSSDVIKSACQQITKQCWEHGQLSGIFCISPYVIQEASAGDPQAAAERLEVLREIPVFPVAAEIPELADFLLLGGGLPAKAGIDALHIACAAYHRMDILLTWNSHNILPIRQSCLSCVACVPPEDTGSLKLRHLLN